MEKEMNVQNLKCLNLNTIGIGIFLWIAIDSFTYLLHTIIEKVLMLNAIPFEISFFIYNGVSLIAYCIITLFALNYLKKNQSINYSKLYQTLIVSIVIIMFGRIIFQYIGSNIMDQLYSTEINSYYKNQSEYIILYSFQQVFEYLRYIYLGIILMFLNNSK